MNAESRREMSDRFLTGRLEGRERADFCTHVRGDPDLRRALEEASGFEALAYSMAWWVSGSPGLENEADWSAVAGGQAARVTVEGDTAILTAQEWQSLFDAVFSEVNERKRLRPSGSKFARFPRPLRYLAAACFAGLIAGAGLLWMRQSNTSAKPSRIIAMGQVRPASVEPSSQSPESRHAKSSIVFDSLVIYRDRGASIGRIQPDRGDGIVRLGEKTAMLLEKNSACEITRGPGDAVAVTLDHGDALFSIEKNRYRSFTVRTPHSEVRVTGTIFRVWAGDDTTVISVLEGAVRSRRGSDTATVLIGAGTSARVTRQTICLERGDSAAALPYRCNLLRDFLEENGVWENGRFVRTGISADTDSIEGRFRSLRRALREEGGASAPGVFSFVHQFPNSSMAGELLLDLAAARERVGDFSGALTALDSAAVAGDNDHAAAAMYRSSILLMDTLRDFEAARNAVARYVSRFPYDPRSFAALERLIVRYWDRGCADSADATLTRILALAGPDARLERIIFNHAEKWRATANGADKALDWYASLLEGYPDGVYGKAAADQSRQCLIHYGISRNKARNAHAKDTFLRFDQ